MNRSIALLLPLFGLVATGCGPVLHTEMLGEAIKTFTGKMKSGPEKVWVTNPNENACDSGCQSLCGAGGAGGGKGGALGSLFGSYSKPDGSYDKLAYEVFSNFLTQKKKMQVMESHRHNYATTLGAETRKKMDVIINDGKEHIATTSCEDLCLLDEAKKRKSDKVLVYRILEMKADEMKIHFRMSDVPTGLVEAAQTLHIIGLRAYDYSYGPEKRASSGGGASAASQPEPAGGGAD